ncbi:MAG: radical SAM protein [Elusimicrobia bacterium]|nr:radical SAM protein [Elusimicrobiota bacterium]
MKIILINPSWRFVYGQFKPAAKEGANMPPLGLTYIAAYLRSNGYRDIKIVDVEAGGYNIDDIVEYSPDVIGFTSVTPNFESTCRMASELKKRLDIPLVLGGIHVSVAPVSAMENEKAFDYGVMGEGEVTAKELMDAIKEGKSVENIKGIVRRKQGKIIVNPPRELIRDLDVLPFPARELLNNSDYVFSVPGEGIRPLAMMSSSRGCPFNCVFCASKTIWGRGTRFRSAENVLSEIEEIVNKLRIKYIVFSDDTFTLDRKRVVEICDLIIERKLKFKWQMMTRANLFDEELLLLMKKAGLVRMSIGIESGDPIILKKIKKGVTLQDIRDAYRIAAKVGVETRGSVMLGHPYETRKTAMTTLRFIRNLKDCKQMYINISTPYPGTELYEMAIRGEGGLVMHTLDFSEFRRYGNAVVDVNDLTRKDLIHLQKLGFWMFYMTPSRIFYNLFRSGIVPGLKNVIAFLKSLTGR